MARTLPATVAGREVIFGAGVHAAIYAATRAAVGYAPPIVFEQNLATGGVFAQLTEFRMNSVNAASVQSVRAGGPSRIVPLSPVDDLNWLPNSAHQVRDRGGAWEYPSSGAMCRSVQLTLKDHADVYTGARGMTYNRRCQVFTEAGDEMGMAKRIILAGGVVPKDDIPRGAAIMSGFDFLRKPVQDLAPLKIAIVGAGDTAAQVAEFMVGQGLTAPSTFPVQIDWYGKDSIPGTKDGWMVTAHARWAGLGRHFPQQDNVLTGVIHPFRARGQVTSLGKTAMVNGQVYDLVVMCTGVKPAPAPCPVLVPDVYTVNGMNVAKANGSQTLDGSPTLFTIGIAASLQAVYKPYRSRFTAAQEAIYNLGPRTAALAASLK